MLKTVFCALFLTALPVIGYASCSGGHQAMSCAEGTVWDQSAGACVDRATS
ncbi:chitin-binding domain-containing protein [Marinovum sp.]|uniref:chitin-binding domain-containing protein n=1 Tax=Marinovum sp. TaxID=2024839 RepID=UPI002B27144F|nr:chitin-binding domain-containing protein [Marinovum sp.]